MANSKLTLSMEPEIIKMAKNYAAKNNISVSKLFKNFVDEITKKGDEKDELLERLKNTEIPDWIKGLTVVDKPTPDFDHKVEYGKHLEEKYGL